MTTEHPDREAALAWASMAFEKCGDQTPTRYLLHLESENERLKEEAQIRDGIHVVIKAERDAAQAFKTFVHRRLDAGKVPENPEPPKHALEGCRIGDRLDWIFNQLASERTLREQAEDRARSLERDAMWTVANLIQAAGGSIEVEVGPNIDGDNREVVRQEIPSRGTVRWVVARRESKPAAAKGGSE